MSVHKYLGGGAGKLGRRGQKSFEAPKRGVKKVSNPKKGGSKKFEHEFKIFRGYAPTPIEVALSFYIHSSTELEHF